jgi:hypothetical protein
MKINDFKPGMLVYYRHGDQYGFVTSTTDRFVLVRFLVGNWLITTPDRTSPRQLEIVQTNDNYLERLIINDTQSLITPKCRNCGKQLYEGDWRKHENAYMCKCGADTPQNDTQSDVAIYSNVSKAVNDYYEDPHKRDYYEQASQSHLIDEATEEAIDFFPNHCVCPNSPMDNHGYCTNCGNPV